VSPLRDPLGFDGSPKPVERSGQLLLRRLLPGLDLLWRWRQRKRPPTPSAATESKVGNPAQLRKPDQQ
jgi:hypothetical protein